MNSPSFSSSLVAQIRAGESKSSLSLTFVGSVLHGITDNPNPLVMSLVLARGTVKLTLRRKEVEI